MEGCEEQQEMDQQATIDEQQNGVQATATDDIEEGSLIKAGSDDEGKIFVGGLSWDTSSRSLREYFSQFGDVKDCVIKEDNITKRSRGFGFVLFSDSDSVRKVLEKQDHILDNRNIDPKRAKALKKEHKLFAGGFSPDVETETLKNHFSKFGEIELLDRPNDKNSDKPRGFCFVTYKTEQAVNNAVKERFQDIQGKRCEVKLADAQRDRGRRGQHAGYAYGPGYYQGNWGQPNWNQSYGGYGDFSFGPAFNSGGGGGGGYGSYGGYGPSSGGYGGGQSSYGGYGYQSYASGYGGYGGGGSGYNNQNYNAGQQQAQGALGYGKTTRRGGLNTYKPY